MLPRTYVWSRTQKALIVATSVLIPIALVVFIYVYERDHPLPDASILVGTWEMTSPTSTDSYTLLCLDPEKLTAWHSGTWARIYYDGKQGFSEMTWYAGGQYIYMHIVNETPQIWQIVQILPDELRLRHAKRDYVFTRWQDPSI